MESIHLYNTACPKCRSIGGDKSGDNLGVYDDGHSFCFKCGYHESANPKHRVTKLVHIPKELPDKQPILLPEDCDTYIPAVARSWLGKYDITEYEITANRIMWSEKYEQLIFPYFDIYNNLLAWQGRRFPSNNEKVGHGNNFKSKWFTQGDIKSLYHILPKYAKSDTLVVVEDIVSAIKVARVENCMPVFTSRIGPDRYKTLCNRFKTIKIWLDPNMRKQSILEVSIGLQFGLDMKVVFSDKDPKEESMDRISELLTEKKKYDTL